jgi:small subunit ribosomal protein S5
MENAENKAPQAQAAEEGSSQPKRRRKQQRREPGRRNIVIIDNNEVELTERVVKMARVAKVVKGGRRFSFNALTVVGDNDAYVGYGFGKAKEVPEAIRKSIEDAKKNLIKVHKVQKTVPHVIMGRYKSSRVLLKPGAPGTGIIAGDAVRAVLELGGVQDVLTKAFGSRNSLNLVQAAINALEQLETPNVAKERRGIPLNVLFGRYSSQRKEEKMAAASKINQESA